MTIAAVSLLDYFYDSHNTRFIAQVARIFFSCESPIRNSNASGLCCERLMLSDVLRIFTRNPIQIELYRIDHLIPHI